MLSPKKFPRNVLHKCQNEKCSKSKFAKKVVLPESVGILAAPFASSSSIGTRKKNIQFYCLFENFENLKFTPNL